MKKSLLIFPLLMTTISVSAQNGTAVSSNPFNDPLVPIYALSVLTLVIVVLVVFVGLSVVRVINTLTRQVEMEQAKQLGIAFKARPSLWSKIWQGLNGFVPVEQEKKIELDHNFDGIKELDNHLPPWWKWLFYGTIAWSAVYVLVFHFTDTLPLQNEEYQNEVAMADEVKRKYLQAQPKAQIDENNLTYTNDEAIIKKGQELYTINCAPCHKANGAGGIGPNLTDEYWLHGGNVKDVYATIKNGVPEKGMVSWANVMSPEQMRDVTFFVISIQGTKPADGKSPQGELVKRVEAELKSDSIKVQASL